MEQIALHAAAAGRRWCWARCWRISWWGWRTRHRACWWALFVFQVPLRGSVPLLVVSTCVFLFGALFWGIFVSAAARTQLQAYQMGMLSSFLPAFLLSGFVYSIENMPPVIQVITRIVPARYFVTILKGVFLKGVGLADAVGRAGVSGALRRHRISAGHAQTEPEAGVTLCGNEFAVILRKEFDPGAARAAHAGAAVPAAAGAVARLRLRRQPGRGPRAHRLDGHGPHARQPRPARALRRLGPVRRGGRCRATKRTCSARSTAAQAQAVVRVLPDFARDLKRGPPDRGAGAGGRHQFQHGVAGFELRRRDDRGLFERRDGRPAERARADAQPRRGREHWLRRGDGAHAASGSTPTSTAATTSCPA